MSCNFYHGKCLFLNGNPFGCIGCPVKRAYNKGRQDAEKKIEQPKNKGGK